MQILFATSMLEGTVTKQWEEVSKQWSCLLPTLPRNE